MSEKTINFASRDFRAIIAYCYRRALTAQEATDEINDTLGSNTVIYSTVTHWYREFKFGRTSLEDMPKSGRPREVTTDENVARIRELLQVDPRMTLIQMAYTLNISTERVHHILHNYLNARHVCVKWVPHVLSADQMATRVKICRENLKIFSDGGDHFIYRLVTGDETYVYFYDNLNSKEAKLWVIEDEEIPKLAKREVHLGKGEKVTADWYVKKCLPQVFESVCEDRPKSGLTGIFLHHDNARPHKALVTTKYLKDNGIRLLAHPPYSPDLAPADFWLFKNLKKHLRGTVFNSEIEIDIAIESFLGDLSPADWRGVYEKWVDRMKRVIRANGDYI
ncbi:histone-lysine N-methyltransferase SETMAR-like [Oppia nitens]|uniref:histone-lysine N-methyltransferase SETMAR-like n=1 Tax=Oppia nitens TaxID=1686743 RepID=UPI0023D999C5|nr:histone-lysine N-methyltransferase SETMAR-like [Oppia nitens]XP_054158650.1 histone-lysine N-methyltransferase SETMAR-like [Oppia nitens]